MVGVDLGITHLAVLSTPVAGVSAADGSVANPRHLEHAQRGLRRLQRQASRRTGPDQRTGAQPSKRWRAESRNCTHGWRIRERTVCTN